MPASPDPTPFADWLRNHAVPLTHLDPNDPLDELEPLREVIGGARVVAIGENSHFITEFKQMRQRMLRFLVERCGFTVLAFEYGFSEGFPLDAWAQGAGTDDELAAHLAGIIPVGVDEPLRWIRRHNATAATPVRFAGIDIPAAGGSLLPALSPVADYLREVDPQTLPANKEASKPHSQTPTSDPASLIFAAPAAKSPAVPAPTAHDYRAPISTSLSSTPSTPYSTPRPPQLPMTSDSDQAHSRAAIRPNSCGQS